MAYDLDMDPGHGARPALLERFRLAEKIRLVPDPVFKRDEAKVMIICAYAVEPSLYIVDEPFFGVGSSCDCRFDSVIGR